MLCYVMLWICCRYSICSGLVADLWRICCGFVVQRTDSTTMVVDKVKYTTNLQQDKFTRINVYESTTLSPQQIEVMEFGPYCT